MQPPLVQIFVPSDGYRLFRHVFPFQLLQCVPLMSRRTDAATCALFFSRDFIRCAYCVPSGGLDSHLDGREKGTSPDVEVFTVDLTAFQSTILADRNPQLEESDRFFCGHHSECASSRVEMKRTYEQDTNLFLKK